LKISIVQTNVHYKNKIENVSNLRYLLSQSNDLGEIILLPELFSTGYIFDKPSDIHKLAESAKGGKTVLELQSIAAEFNVVIVCGIAEKVDNSYFNSSVVVDKLGVKCIYQKISQTNIDKQYFTRGQSIVTFEYSGVKFGLAICFDIWFPEIVREYTKQNIDVLLHPANFGSDQSLHIARARAIENSIYVVTCNRIGTESAMGIDGFYCGKSQVIDPQGNVLFSAGKEVILQTIDIEISSEIEKSIIGVKLGDEITTVSNIL